MVETIAPVVYGDKRRYLGAVALHALAAGLAGASFGMALSALGLVLDAPWGTVGAVVIAIAAAAYAARELLGLPLPIFDRKKQVPDWWRTFYSPHVAATLYGAGLGIGFLTFLRYGTYVVVCVIAFASGEVLWGALLGATFGITRGLTSLMSSRTHDEEQAAGVVLRMERVAVGRGPKTANGLILLLVAVVALATACDPTSVAAPSSSPSAATPPASPSVTEAPIQTRRYSRSRSLGRLEDPRIEESSGLAASRSQPDVLWTHNDSGDGPFVYAIGDDGRSLGRWKVTGARAVDWEDIAIGPGAGPADDIYIGDIGDNNARRDRVTVYRFAEPRIDDSSSGTGAATALHFTYPGGSRDAEALLVHPRSGDLYVVTKDFSGRAAVFVARAPLRSGELVALARLRLPGALGGVTGGDISPDGTRLALSTYLGALELFLPVATAPFDDIWKRRPASIAVDGRSQGESIAYSADGTSLIATSEGVGATIQVVRTR